MYEFCLSLCKAEVSSQKSDLSSTLLYGSKFEGGLFYIKPFHRKLIYDNPVIPIMKKSSGRTAIYYNANWSIVKFTSVMVH